jgi:phosphohistidine phosphatase SixA
MDAAAGINRTLILMRHAKSAWPDGPDHDRPLAQRAQRDAPLTPILAPGKNASVTSRTTLPP